MVKVTSKLLCGKVKGGKSSPLSFSLCKRHTSGVPGRNVLSSDVEGMAGLWICVQVSCSSITWSRAAREMRFTWKKYRLRALKPFCSRKILHSCYRVFNRIVVKVRVRE